MKLVSILLVLPLCYAIRPYCEGGSCNTSLDCVQPNGAFGSLFGICCNSTGPSICYASGNAPIVKQGQMCNLTAPCFSRCDDGLSCANASGQLQGGGAVGPFTCQKIISSFTPGCPCTLSSQCLGGFCGSEKSVCYANGLFSGSSCQFSQQCISGFCDGGSCRGRDPNVLTQTCNSSELCPPDNRCSPWGSPPPVIICHGFSALGGLCYDSSDCGANRFQEFQQQACVTSGGSAGVCVGLPGPNEVCSTSTTPANCQRYTENGVELQYYCNTSMNPPRCVKTSPTPGIPLNQNCSSFGSFCIDTAYCAMLTQQPAALPGQPGICTPLSNVPLGQNCSDTKACQGTAECRLNPSGIYQCMTSSYLSTCDHSNSTSDDTQCPSIARDLTCACNNSCLYENNVNSYYCTQQQLARWGGLFLPSIYRNPPVPAWADFRIDRRALAGMVCCTQCGTAAENTSVFTVGVIVDCGSLTISVPQICDVTAKVQSWLQNCGSYTPSSVTGDIALLLTQDLESTFPGENVTFTLSVSSYTPGLGTPTFNSHTVAFDVGQVGGGCTEIFQNNPLSISCTISSLSNTTAVSVLYYGDTNFSSAESPVLTHYVFRLSVRISQNCTSSSNGDPILFTANFSNTASSAPPNVTLQNFFLNISNKTFQWDQVTNSSARVVVKQLPGGFSQVTPVILGLESQEIDSNTLAHEVKGLGTTPSKPALEIILPVVIIGGACVIGVVVVLLMKKKRESKVERKQVPTSESALASKVELKPLKPSESADSEEVKLASSPSGEKIMDSGFYMPDAKIDSSLVTLASSASRSAASSSSSLSSPSSKRSLVPEQASLEQKFPSFIWDLGTLSPRPDREEEWKHNQLGKGGFGCVYQAVWTHAHVSQTVAVKVLTSSYRIPREAKMDLIRELRIASSVSHLNLATFYGVALDKEYKGDPLDREIAIIMRLEQRGSLFSLLKDPKVDLPWPRRLGILIHVAAGMLCLHSCNPRIIHRDLKAANILISADWIARVTDFGLSRVIDTEDQTQSLNPFGTPYWLAPECVEKNEFGIHSDVYGFGILMFEVMTRQIPTRDWRGSKQPPIIPSELECPAAIGCPLEYVDLMKACWGTDPKTRPKFDEIHNTLEKIDQVLERLDRTS